MTGGRVTLQPAPVNDVRDQFGRIFAGIIPFLPPPNDDAVKTQDIQVRKDLRVRTYVPTGLKDPLPVGLYIHCGGWFTGSIEGEDHLCRNIAESSKIILVSPEYRLAPEHPYPAGLDDCCAAYEWMHANASKYGGDHKKKFIMGGSAGGILPPVSRSNTPQTWSFDRLDWFLPACSHVMSRRFQRHIGKDLRLRNM